MCVTCTGIIQIFKINYSIYYTNKECHEKGKFNVQLITYTTWVKNLKNSSHIYEKGKILAIKKKNPR